MRKPHVHGSARERFLEKAWAWTIVLYSVCATYVVYKTLTKYGANAIVYFIIDIPTSWFYGIATARLVVTAVKRDWKPARYWALLAVINFAIPQAYIIYYAKNASTLVYEIVIAVLTVITIVSFASVGVQIRKKWKSDQESDSAS
jgi:hypothetical protein